MPESTSNVGLRYPTPTEPNDVPADVQRLAEDVDELFPNGGGTFQKRLYFHLTQSGGAVGQDPTADTAAWLEALKSGWPIYVPDGEFHVDTAFRKSVDAAGIDEFVITGAGETRANIKWVGSGDGPMLWLSENDARSRIDISGVWFSSSADRGHTSTTYDTFTTTSSDVSGTSSTATCLRADRATQGTVFDRVSISDFEEGIRLGDFTYGWDIRTCLIRWCNIGVNLDTPTTGQISGGSIIERNAIGVRLRGAQLIEIENSTIEGNYAGTDVFDYQWNDRIRFSRIYFEASPNVYWHRGDSSGDFQTAHVTFTECFGLECYFGNFIEDVRLERNRLTRLENNYVNQDGERRIVCVDNRKADGSLFGPEDVTGPDADAAEVIFLGEPEGRDYTRTSERVRLDNRTRTFYQRVGSSSSKENLAVFAVPPDERAWIIEVEGIKSRAPTLGVGVSRAFRAVFAIARDGSGSDVVLDHLDTLGYEVKTTSAGGDNDVSALTFTIERTGSEASDADQEVAITFNNQTTIGASSTTVATVNAIGYETVDSAV